MRVIVTAIVVIGMAAVHAGPSSAEPRWAAVASVTVSPEHEQQSALPPTESVLDVEAIDPGQPDPEMPVLD